MKAWKTKSYFLGPAGHKMEVLDLTYKGIMPKGTPDIHTKALQSSRSSRNLAMLGRS